MNKIWKHRRIISWLLIMVMICGMEFPVKATNVSDNTQSSESSENLVNQTEENNSSGDEMEKSGTSEEGEDEAEEPGTPEEGKDGAEEPGTSEEGKDGTEEPGISEEGIEEPETENTGNVDTTPVISEDTAALLAEFIEMLATLPTADGSLNQEEFDQVLVAYNKYSAVYAAFMTDNGDGSFDFDEYLLSTYEGTVENFYALLATPMTTDEPIEVEEVDSNELQLPTSLPQELRNVLPGQDRNIKVHLFDYGTAINPSYIYTGVLESSDTRVLEFADEQPSALDGYQKNTGSQPIMSPSLVDGYPYVVSYPGKTAVTIKNAAKSQTIKNENGESITSNTRHGSLQYLFDEGKDFVDANGENYPGVTYNPVTGQYDGTLEESVKNLTGTENLSNFKSQHYEVINNDAGSTGLFRQIGNYLQFDSKDNFAWYNPENKLFQLYDFALRPYGGAAAKRARGHFLPFNSNLSYTTQVTDEDAKIIEGNRVAVNLGNEDDYNAVTEKIANVWALPNEETKTSPNTPDRSQMANYWYGMSVEFEFYMPAGGMVGDEQMVFQFLGDDDVWVYIDGRLVLDMGKSNGQDIGTINFATGIIEGSNDGEDVKDDEGKIIKKGVKSLEQCFTENGGIKTGSDGKPIAEFQNLEKGGSTFADYTKHKLKFFYLERGGGSCNCRLRFNMPTLPDKSLTVTKELTSDNERVGDFIKNSVPYQFRVVKAVDGKATDVLYITPGTEYDILEGTTTVATGVVDENGYFTIKGGQSALFTKMLEKASDDGNTSYIVEEIIPDNVSGQYGGVEYSIGGTPGTITTEDKGQSEFTTYQTGALDATAAQVVAFKNKVTTSNLSTLKITKKIAAGSNLNEKNTYRMRVTLGGVQLAKGTEYRINGETNTVSDDGCVVLKAGETAVISGILSGTKYVIEEQDVEKNKYRVTYEGKETVGAETKNLTFDNAANAANGTVKTSSTTDITITNATYDFSGSIPISKQYLGNGSETKTFQFNIEQVNKNGNTIEGAKQLPGTSITVTNADATAGSIVIGYKAGTAGTFYYKVSETVGSDDKKQIFYDHSVYYVTMKVEDGAAKVIDVKKHGDESYSWKTQDVLPFVNRSVVRLTIDKTVTGNMGDINRAFPFDISISIGTEPYVTGTLYCYQNNALIQLNYNNQSENYTFNLQHNQSIQLLVPYGCNYTLSENMKAEWKYDSTTFIVDTEEPKVYNNPISAVEISNENLTAAQTISVTNHKEEIPDTGISLDSMPYILVLALAVVGVAIFVIFKRKRRDDD